MTSFVWFDLLEPILSWGALVRNGLLSSRSTQKDTLLRHSIEAPDTLKLDCTLFPSDYKGEDFLFSPSFVDARG